MTDFFAAAAFSRVGNKTRRIKMVDTDKLRLEILSRVPPPFAPSPAVQQAAEEVALDLVRTRLDLSVEAICEICGISWNRIYKIKKEAGIPYRPSGRKRGLKQGSRK